MTYHDKFNAVKANMATLVQVISEQGDYRRVPGADRKLAIVALSQMWASIGADLKVGLMELDVAIDTACAAGDIEALGRIANYFEPTLLVQEYRLRSTRYVGELLNEEAKL